MTQVSTKQVIGTTSRNIGTITKAKDTDLITDFVPTYSNSKTRIGAVARGNGAVITLQRTVGETTTTEVLFAGATLTAGQYYDDEFESDKTETINIQAGAAQTEATFILVEVV